MVSSYGTSLGNQSRHASPRTKRQAPVFGTLPEPGGVGSCAGVRGTPSGADAAGGFVEDGLGGGGGPYLEEVFLLWDVGGVAVFAVVAVPAADADAVGARAGDADGQFL